MKGDWGRSQESKERRRPFPPRGLVWPGKGGEEPGLAGAAG